AADPANAAYAAAPGGRLLELPVFLPDVHYGSTYFYYDLQVRLERPGGYSTTAPAVADRVARELERLNCGDWSGIDLGALGVRSIAVHRGLYEHNAAVPDRWWFATLGLLRHGWKAVAVDGEVSMWGRGSSGPVAAGEPARGTLHFCQGWYGPERLLELLFELARHRQLLDDVGASDQLALDEDLRDRRPPVEPGELLADRRIWEDVDRRDRRARLLERAQGAV